MIEDRLLQIKHVVDNSEHVKIDMDSLRKYAGSLKITKNEYWLRGIPLNISEKEYILLMFLAESMNFCFWKEPYIEKTFNGVHHKRSIALVYAIIDKALSDKEFLNIDILTNLSKQELLSILGGDNNMPLIDERYNNLVETINLIHSKGETFYNDLFSKTTDEELLNYIVSEFPSFRDISSYKGKEVCFYKRATLLVHDLFEVSSTIKNNINNIDSLLACADYGIPRTLRYFNVLNYSKELNEMIDNKTIIAHDSAYEIEIRANMIYAIELIKEELADKGIIINSITLDDIIWLSGRNIKAEHHRTETIYY